ncbi:hypothetical protein OAG68_00110 [bacterium]|nr:hypothetical protein [bacterium]
MNKLMKSDVGTKLLKLQSCFGFSNQAEMLRERFNGSVEQMVSAIRRAPLKTTLEPTERLEKVQATEQRMKGQGAVIANDWELQELAYLHLRRFVENDKFGFLSGHYGGSGNANHLRRFNEVCELLSDQVRQEIIDLLDETFRCEEGDSWQAYKYSVHAGFFSKPVDIQAIQRLVEELPNKNWDEVGNVYSFDYADVLKEVDELSCAH